MRTRPREGALPESARKSVEAIHFTADHTISVMNGLADVAAVHVVLAARRRTADDRAADD